MKEDIRYTSIDSPIGEILVAQSDKGLNSIRFASSTKPELPLEHWRYVKKLKTTAIDQLRAYFQGTLKDFSLPLDLNGTPFQLKVWNALQKIPYGQTISYGELARWIGNPKAVRAVGGANGKNPIPLIVPCHRVIGSDGSLTGYGSGLPIKSALLEHEREFSLKT
jgi:methylated-DNA-[protein]-cysteine S-methyltransferase